MCIYSNEHRQKKEKQGIISRGQTRYYSQARTLPRLQELLQEPDVPVSTVDNVIMKIGGSVASLAGCEGNSVRPQL